MGMLLYLPSEAKDDPIDLIRRHRYEEAIAIWDKEMEPGKVDEKNLRALKGQSLAYLRLGSLYSDFAKLSTGIMEEYYSTIIEDGTSTLHHFYLGQIQIRVGKFAEAKASFEAAKKLANSSPGILELNEIFLFYARRRLGEVSGEPPMQPKDNAAQWQLLELRGSSDIPLGLTDVSQRGRRCKLEVLLRNPTPSEAEIRATLKAVLSDGQQPEAYLDQGKNTQINFYDPFLLSTLSDAFYGLSKVINLRIREGEKKFPDLASKFGTDLALAEACLRLGQVREAAIYLGKDGSLQGRLLTAQMLAKQKKSKEALQLLDGLAREAKTPGERKDIADVYYLLGLELDKGLKLAAQALRDKNGPNYYRTYASLLFATGQYDAALQQFAKGYKIEYRNRIDQIDPEYMASYSFAIFKTNKLRYEEIVETLYHLQKEFPACRQMHYCMQGISAGLARSYESQRIFRKGG